MRRISFKACDSLIQLISAISLISFVENSTGLSNNGLKANTELQMKLYDKQFVVVKVT